MRKTLLAICLTLALASCANLQTAWNVVTGAQVTAQTVLVAANAFDALEATATNYLRLPRCKTSGHPVICRSPAATRAIIPAVRSGRVARDDLLLFFKNHPGQLGPTGLYDALVGANHTLQGVFAQYHVGGN